MNRLNQTESATVLSFGMVVLVSVVFNPDHGSNSIEFTRAQFSHRIVPGQAVKQFTSSQETETSVHSTAVVQCE
jgi:hypothetical protein